MQKNNGGLMIKNYSSRCKVMHTAGQPSFDAGGVLIEDITPITPDTPVDQVLSICLNNMGFPTATEVIPGKCFELKQHLASCPTCRSHHDDPHYMVTSLVEECFTVKNLEKHCRGRILNIQTMVEEHEALKKILEHPNADAPLAELYVSERGKSLVSSGGVVHRFHQGRWSLFDQADMDNEVKDFLDRVLEALKALLIHEESIQQSVGVARGDLKHLRELRDKFIKASDFVQNVSRRGNILKAISNRVNDSKLQEKWDSLPHLGVNNGIVDLATCTFRPARKEDYVTMSCGYDWLDTVDPEVEAQVEDFFQKVYPDEQERRMFQQWVGYCLTGHHREKFLLLLTDRRSGFNAKSTVLSLVSATMGDYAIKGDAALYYSNDRHNTVNDHSAGLLTYQKKRMLYIEETHSNRVIDSSTCKDLNGGDPKMAGRGLYKNAITEFPWITKTIIAFNENRFPAVDVDDQALMERFLAIPHRSRFYSGALPDEPHSFPADSTVKDNFDLWKPYVLRWALDGLRMYHEHRFKNIPQSCRNFMNSIVEEKDTVKEFLTNAIEEGDPKDFVKLKELYNDYSEAYRPLQKDKKTFKNMGSFQGGVTRVLKRDAFVKKHFYNTEQGARTSVNSVVVGFKRRRV